MAYFATDWTNISSGLLGAVLGAATTFALYWHSGKASARIRLLGELTIFRYRVWQEVKPDDGYISALPLWRESLVPLWRAYLEYYRWLFFWQRGRMNHAWRAYKGADEDTVMALPSATGLPKSKQELLDRFDRLIKETNR